MNRVLQPEVHPDAESLNAFVERALPQPERAQIVAHLGGCARCREVVFLAQAAAEADAVPSHAPTVDTRLRKPSFWAGIEKWRIALIPAAALSLAAAILIWVHMKPAAPAATVAQVAPPPLSPLSSSAAMSVPRPAQVPATSLAPPASVQHVQPKAARAVPAVPASDNPHWNSEAWVKQAARGQGDGEMNAPIISSLAIAAPPQPAPVPPNLTAVHGNVMAPAAAGPRPLAAEATSAQAELMPQPVNGMAALRLASHLRLPSGLNAVSSAVMLDRILAVDSEGSVFLSRDAAKHWERVPTQWTGKAVVVQAPPRGLNPLNASAPNDATVHTSPVASVSINPETPVPAPAAPPPPVQSIKAAESVPAAPAPTPSPASGDAAPPMPGMLFKLINDHHQMWVSADGKVWHEQQGRE